MGIANHLVANSYKSKTHTYGELVYTKWHGLKVAYANMWQRKIKSMQPQLQSQSQSQSHSQLQPVSLDTFTLLQLRLFQLLGLCSVPLQSQADLAMANPRPPTTIIHLWTSVNHDSILYNSDSFGIFNDLLKFIATIISHFIILSETIIQRQYMEQFLLAYTRLHNKWSSHTFRPEYAIYRKYVWRSSICIVIVIIIDLAYIQEISKNRSWLAFFIPFVPSGLICHLRSLQIMYFMDMLRIEVMQLNRNVERLVTFSERHCVENSQRSEYFVRIVCAELQILMECYQNIYELSMLLKKAVGISLTCNYIKEYVMILSECYWSYWMVYNGQDVIEYSLMTPSALTIFLLLITSRNCMRSTNFLAHNVHKIRHDVEDLNISTRLQSFALQISHQRIIMDGFGFFVLNCNMARDILGSIATYMIFFIQFMPKFKTF
ncbi:gustatory receptor 8a [Ceratitis capitata]|uniref:gustatory receptor 8a n=1 Tax=Ceratitis capitata TaxID=7213 RepID=UPI000A109E48|nr:gustatory receptor 8a [Ceratitis capitata]